MARYDYWTHGVNTYVELDERDRDIGLDIGHMGFGTKICPSETFSRRIVRAWLHIPITTPTTQKNDETIELKYLYLRGWLENAGRINRFHIRQGDDDPLYDEILDGVDLGGDPGRVRVEKRIDPVPREINEGLVLSIHVEFQNPASVVTITGVGACFEN
jgi:hypothetical protein